MNYDVAYTSKGFHWDDDTANDKLESGTSYQAFCQSSCLPETCDPGEIWDPVACACAPDTPIVLDLDRDGYDLTDLVHGVRFDLNADGAAERLSWTIPGGDDGFLAFDRNGNGMIDDGTELFGNSTPTGSGVDRAQNGFEALLALERTYPGNAVDGIIDAADALFHALTVWVDIDHDGVSDPAELLPLRDTALVALETDYRWSGRRDQHGNEFRLKARSWWRQPGAASVGLPRYYYDVWLRVAP